MLLLSVFWGILVSEAFEAPFFFLKSGRIHGCVGLFGLDYTVQWDHAEEGIHPILDQRIRIVEKIGS